MDDYTRDLPVEDVGEDADYRGAPPLLFSSNILQLASEPDLAPASALASRPDVVWESTDPRSPSTASVQASNHPPLFGQSSSPTDVAPSNNSLGEKRLREATGDYPATRSAPSLGASQAPSATSLGKRRQREDAGHDSAASADHQHIAAPSATSLGKRRQREDAGHDSAASGTQYLAGPQVHPISHVGDVRFHTEGPHYTTGIEPSESDPALTYLPGYQALVSPQSVVPMELKLQDSPAIEAGEGTKFVTVYTLNKQYGFSKTQTSHAAVPVDSIALKCSDIPKLTQLYRYFTAQSLSEVVARHRLQTSTRMSSLVSIIANHRCDTLCPGYSDVFVFHRLQRPRTVKHNTHSDSRFFELTFDNAPRDDGPGVISTYGLNRHFEFVSVGAQSSVELMYGNSTGHLICKTSSIADFVGHFIHLNMAQLTAIAQAHALEPRDNKSALIQTLLRHACSDSCGADHLVFIRRLYPREGHFQPHSVSVEPSGEGAHTLSMSEVDVLPIVMANQMQVDERDGHSHISTYLLNASFDFVEILSSTTLRTHKAVDFGTKSKTSRLAIIEPKTVDSVQAAEKLRRERFIQQKDAKKHDTRKGPLKEAVAKAITEAQESFPFIADVAHRHSIAKRWQEEMNPLAWIPAPCAICGRHTKKSDLESCNPLHFDLTLLKNPVLPVAALPTTYNLAAYDGAILCPEALHDTSQKGPMAVCPSCRSSMAAGLQPPDSLANFQYYGRAELPSDVRSAFEQATPFDLLLSAYSRSTRITYLFCDKDGGQVDDATRMTSQGYSKGNVAVFAQDITTLRKVLPPPRHEIQEAMCALFVGPSTVPTKENIEALRPVLVSKTRVQTILDFLLTKNAYYMTAGVQFSDTNLAELYPEPAAEGVLDTVELCCLPESTLDIRGYADRGDNNDTGSAAELHTAGETVMEAVGYVVGEKTPRDFRNMKAAAVAWCLDRNNYLRV
ncbi:hypothetical protein B0H14DRAFT_3459667 [Mycena olivaceomarginata]|nr:hypothetical protein B0H14DRAFT_3459667 [Mycena olivaceomarginata]